MNVKGILTDMDIANRRLYSQHIDGEKFDTPLQVVRHMGAMQAQDFGQAVWAVGLRMKHPSIAAVEKAIANKEIVLTWPMRGTIHFVPGEDAGWMLQLMAQRGVRAGQAHARLLGVDERVMAKAETAFSSALSGGKQLTRSDMMQCLTDAGIDTAAQRGYLLLRHFAQTGLLCLASAEGKQQTFSLLNEWIPSSRVLEKNEALAEIARRYFLSHGPATLKDFAGWTGITMTDVKYALDAVKQHLEAVMVDGKEFWYDPTLSISAPTSARVHLLPGFDEFYLGYKDRSDIVENEHAAKIVPGGNGVFKPIIIRGGRVVGTWQRVIKKDRVNVAFSLFTPPNEPREVYTAEAERYAAFMGLHLGTIEGV